MKMSPLFLIIFVFLTGCSRDYLLLADVPPYTHPSISPEDAQQEINELAQERGLTRPSQDTKK